MTNTQLLILAIVIIAIYLYWKYYSNTTIAPKPDDIIERKGKAKQEVFWDANEWEINSDNHHD